MIKRWLICLAALFLMAYSIDIVAAQTVVSNPLTTSSTMMVNGTQFIPVYLPPPQAQQSLQGVAQQTDNNTTIGLISLAITGIGIPLAAKFLANKDKKGEEIAKQDNGQNTFRLEATSSALKAQNQSLQETDKAGYDLSRIVQGLVKVMTQKPELKAMFNTEKIDGIGLVDFTDRFVADSKQDLEEYYNRNNLPEDDFDTCKDPIVQSVTAVRNKSRK